MKKKKWEIFSQLWWAVVPTTKHEGEWENSSLTSSSYLSPRTILKQYKAIPFHFNFCLRVFFRTVFYNNAVNLDASIYGSLNSGIRRLSLPTKFDQCQISLLFTMIHKKSQYFTIFDMSVQKFHFIWSCWRSWTSRVNNVCDTLDPVSHSMNLSSAGHISNQPNILILWQKKQKKKFFDVRTL